MIQKFGRLNVTAPIFKEDLPKTIKELEEMRLAFLEVGDFEKELAKAKFLKDNAQTDEEYEALKLPEPNFQAPEERLKMVHKVGELRKKQAANGSTTSG